RRATLSPETEAPAASERPHSGEIASRPGSFLQVERFPVPYRGRSPRDTPHRKCHDSTASPARETRGADRSHSLTPRRMLTARHRLACEHTPVGHLAHRLRDTAGETEPTREACLL